MLLRFKDFVWFKYCVETGEPMWKLPFQTIIKLRNEQSVLNYSENFVAWYATVCHLRIGRKVGREGGHLNKGMWIVPVFWHTIHGRGMLKKYLYSWWNINNLNTYIPNPCGQVVLKSNKIKYKYEFLMLDLPHCKHD